MSIKKEKLTAALVGAGNRGCVYADYSLVAPEELEIIAVVEPNNIRRNNAVKRYSIKSENAFADLDTFIKANIVCDFIINATMDELHYETAKQIIEAKYDMLLEKPIVNNREQLLNLQRIAKANKVRVNICHVLRYTPFYKKIKELILDGAIGKIQSMEMNEHVGIAHFLDSFVRGKWNSQANCGSGFLLQKSCHDIDLACWLNNSTEPKLVSSMGGRSLFIKENAPQGATKYCYNCPHNQTCLYSAQKVHLEYDSMPFQTWSEIGKPIDTITKQEKEEWLKSSTYGLCAYNSGGDINDRQVVQIVFANGSVCSFTMVGATSLAGRYIHICGTHGEIEGRLETGKFYLRQFDRSGDKFAYQEKEFDVNKEIRISKEYAGHGGGDYAIMYETVRYLRGEKHSLSITNIDDSINGHLVVYSAEESVKNGHACACK